MAKHALLSPSATSRWLACPPSARAEAKIKEKPSPFAEEGTIAHSLSELLLSKFFGLLNTHTFNRLLEKCKTILNPATKQSYYSPEMGVFCEEYRDFVIERVRWAQQHAKDAKLFLEEKIDLSAYIEEGFGTGDVVIVTDGYMELIDLKYGQGVPVSAVDNAQLKVYALGLLERWDYIYDIPFVRLTIYQPRLDNISTWEIDSESLRKWGNEILRPAAIQAYKGEGKYKAGTHCKFCKLKGTCKTLADYNLEIAKYDFQEPSLLSDAEISDILNRAADFTNWINAVKDEALTEALKGKHFPGYKIVKGRSNRKYIDETKVREELIKKGWAVSQIIQPEKIKTITEMEKLLGKPVFEKTLSGLIIKPEGAPALVHESDSRPAINSTESAIKDFA